MPSKPKTPTPKQQCKLLGDKIRKARVSKGWSINTLARECGYNKGGISILEQGNRAPTVTVLRRIADALDLPVSYFL